MPWYVVIPIVLPLVVLVGAMIASMMGWIGNDGY